MRVWQAWLRPWALLAGSHAVQLAHLIRAAEGVKVLRGTNPVAILFEEFASS